ncbi:BA14K family protein [Roseiarcaceae bacterium H3SJ34-1]|uniref:BA14K family protein n=1 Tax=Terripilifer ovatus TaxID=3032367 RepID=UPI003AB96BCE|nr:BA14K family protein [Roseiarcaceae bacterium H3SJ34-1]
MLKFLMVGTALAALSFAAAAPAAAQAARPDPGVGTPFASSVTNVQFRRGFGGRWGGRGYYGRGYYGGGYGRGWGYGAAGLGLGLATGAIIGGAIASQPYAYEPAPVYDGGGDATAYCMSRFKSYDPGSGTYLGYDGFRHPCP